MAVGNLSLRAVLSRGSAPPVTVKDIAAGIAFVADDNTVLLLKRSAKEENFAGHWAFPGGKADDGETGEEAARREAIEEMGNIPIRTLRSLDTRDTPNGMEFTTFVCEGSPKFIPTLNGEHTDYRWASLDDLPQPMHPAVARTLAESKLTGDKAASEDAQFRFYTPVKIGPKRSLTPEGFLLCEDVPIARIGELIYVGGEVPVDSGRDGLVRISRDEAQVFAPATVASFLGKPITVDHPDEDVTPANWRSLSVGTIVAVRRGTGDLSDFLLADFLIQDEAAIAKVTAGNPEVSCGYDADYEQIEPGKGRQTNIIGNHVALVDKGRCGPRCFVGDNQSLTSTGGSQMGAKRTLRDRIWTAFKAQDEAALTEELDKVDEGSEPQKLVIELKQPEAEMDDETKDDGEQPDVAALIQAMDEKFTAAITDIAGRLAKLEAGEVGETMDNEHGDKDDGETKDEEGEEEGKTDEEKSGKTTDSAGLKSEFTETLARAEILSPGIKLPTFDAKADQKKTADSLCALRRKALANAFKDDDRKEFVTPFVGDHPDFTKLTCDAAKQMFVGASELAKRANNRAQVFDNTRRAATDAHANSIKSINEAHRAFWKR